MGLHRIGVSGRLPRRWYLWYSRSLSLYRGSALQRKCLADQCGTVSGWRRDFLLLVDGWAKDADANTAFSQTVLPLPFHAMTSYPYPAGEHYPADADHAAYRKRYNTRPALKLLRPLVAER